MSWQSRTVFVLLGCGLAAGATWYGVRAYRAVAAPKQEVIPVAKVQRGDLSLTVTANGSLNGGTPEVLTAPMIGGTDLHITTLKTSGEPVKEGEVVVEFDTTEQEYKLKEAEADLAEAEQHIAQANAEAQAQAEEDTYAISKAKADIRSAELDVRKNPLLAFISAKENTLALEGAQDHLNQLERNIANRKATSDAALAIQEAGKSKSESQAKTAKENIESMTLKAHRAGYFSVRPSTPTICCFTGVTLPPLQSGDTVRPGMAVAEIPDLKNWELAANVSELDRGHLSIGQKVEITVVAVPTHIFKGTVKDLGATGGPAWDRHFECKIGLDDPSIELRPGMSARIVVTTDQLHGVLSLPAQALFESDGRTFVYVRAPGGGFAQKDVKLARRSEMRVVLDGLNEGQEVALSNPTDIEKEKGRAWQRDAVSRKMSLFQTGSRYSADFALAASNLWAQKTRTLLTAMGIIFGVGAVIGMLAIGAGAKDESLRFIEQLGVRNLLIESRPAASEQELNQRRRSSPGLTERDVRILTGNVDDLDLISARRSLHPARVFPRANDDLPELYGVRPAYASIHNWKLAEGTFFTKQQDDASVADCILGEKAKVALLGYGTAVNKFVKVNDTWLRVAGVLQDQASSGSGTAQSEDPNLVIYVPLNTFQYRFFQQGDSFKDDLDGVDIRLKVGADSFGAAKVVTAILNSTHKSIPDFVVTIPAELLAEQQRSQSIFTYVMVAIAAISLLVGGIGIMNIVLATVMERTREIGIRRAIGARRGDIVRQFLLESVLISIGGGVVGIAFGYFLSWAIARAADWKTIVTPASIIIAFGVSVAVGIVFGIYPARKAARIDPIEALRYE